MKEKEIGKYSSWLKKTFQKDKGLTWSRRKDITKLITRITVDYLIYGLAIGKECELQEVRKIRLGTENPQYLI